MSVSPAVTGPGDRQEQSTADTVMRFFSPAARAVQYSLLREAGPLHRPPLGLYLATRHADCAAVLQNISWSHASETAQLHPAVSAEDQGDRLTETELLATCVTLIVAGHETTVNLVASALLALMRQPDQLQLLRDRRELIRSAVEELLRFDPPVAMTTRTATRPFTVGGREFAPGEGVVALICSANRDELAFVDPDRLDVTRYSDRSAPPSLVIRATASAVSESMS